MVITKIERQKRSPHRYNLHINGHFAFGVHEDVLLKFGLRKGDTLEEPVVRSIQSSEELSRARQKALHFLSYRMRSERELRQKLLEKEFPPDVIDSTIEHARNLGLVNDLEFARSLVHDLQIRKPAGRRLLRHRLRLKGIAPEIIDQVLSPIDSSDQESRALEAARTMIKRQRPATTPEERRKLERRIVQFLGRRGFEWGIIGPVMKKLFSKNLASTDEE